MNDGPGFLVNRLLLPYMNEALELSREGAEIKAIERAAKDFGMPMGPITLYDVVGIDTAFYAGRVMWEAFPIAFTASPILPALSRPAGWAKNGGRVLRVQRQEGPRRARPQAERLDHRTHTQERKILDRSNSPRGCSCRWSWKPRESWRAKIVRDVRDVDLGLIFGLGFPPFKGGLLFWADTLGAPRSSRCSSPFSRWGSDLKPTPLLLEMARSGKKFYQNLAVKLPNFRLNTCRKDLP